jgi:hypothetical protein
MNRVEYAKTLFLPFPLFWITTTRARLHRLTGENVVAFLQQTGMQ